MAELTELIVDYAKPPVIEVVCSVQFEAMPALHTACVGRYWERVRIEYPTAEPNPPIASRVETFGLPTAAEMTVSMVAGPPPVRLMMIGSVPNWVLQIQPDRLLLNWRREQSEYVHFHVVFGRFWREWVRFRDFVAEFEDAPLAVNQLELTYVNHIPQGDGWHSIADLHDVFPDVAPVSGERFLPTPESFTWKSAYSLPNQFGRLHASVQHAVRLSDQQSVILCELTARGMPTSSLEDDLKSWFALAHEWIVRGFADMASDSIQNKVWERKNEP